MVPDGLHHALLGIQMLPQRSRVEGSQLLRDERKQVPVVVVLWVQHVEEGFGVPPAGGGGHVELGADSDCRELQGKKSSLENKKRPKIFFKTGHGTILFRVQFFGKL